MWLAGCECGLGLFAFVGFSRFQYFEFQKGASDEEKFVRTEKKVYFCTRKLIVNDMKKICLSLLALLWLTAGAQVKLDCARQVYAVPGERFMQKIRTTEKDARVEVFGLPEGLKWNEQRQLVDGVVEVEGEYMYVVRMCHGNNRVEDTVRLLAKHGLPMAKPFMGLLTWNVFEGEISDEKVRMLADAMADLGLADAGYRYLCLDDLWAEGERDAEGNLQWNAQKFPDGLKPLSDYVHAKGLKFGVYSDGGSRTCSGGQPGSLGFEEQDAKCFVDWGFDLLKYDYCNNVGAGQEVAKATYRAMGEALGKVAPKDFVYYLCEWGERAPWTWGAEVGGQCWRATADTRDCWENATYKGGVLDNIKVMTKIWQYSGVNRFNDADMMMCGLHGMGKSSNAGTNGEGMSQHEYRTQMILWCMWSSPLTLCFDVTTLYDGKSRCNSKVKNWDYDLDLPMITNADLIALDQDALGMAAETVVMDDSKLLLMKDLSNGDVAISATNLLDEAAEVEVRLKDFAALRHDVRYVSKDLVTGDEELGVSATKDTYAVILPAHGSIVWRFSEMK